MINKYVLYNSYHMSRCYQKQFLTGTTGKYSTSNITGQSDLYNGVQDSTNTGAYKTAYQGGIDGSVHLGQIDYTNPRNTLHNNIGDRVLNEQIFDNMMFIDSEIRDHSKHPDPFRFIVKFGGIDPVTDSIQIRVTDNEYSYNKYLSGDTTVNINKVFKNIKAVVINTLILPYSIEYITKNDGSYESCKKNLGKKFHKYIILRINELSNGRIFSNNKTFGQGSFVMKIDDDTCTNHHRWIPISNRISYPDSVLRVIDKLTVEIYDDNGEPLCPKLDGKPHDFYAEYRHLIDNIITARQKNKKGTEENIAKLIPKLNSLKCITRGMSPELHITVCTLEPQIQTLPQY